MAHTIVRCFFNKDGKHRRTVFCEDDSQLVHHKPEADEVVRDIPHDTFKSKFVTINFAALEEYHATTTDLRAQ